MDTQSKLNTQKMYPQYPRLTTTWTSYVPSFEVADLRSRRHPQVYCTVHTDHE